MKLRQLFEQKNQKGTYAGLRFDDESVDNIIAFINEHKVPNPVPRDKFHVTLLYSRKHLPNYKAAGKIDPPWVATPSELVVWQTKPTEHTPKPANCLVLKLECVPCLKRHDDLMTEHNATFDYDEYQPHVTLSYDIGKFDADKLPNPKSIGKLHINNEYQEELNLNWANDNT